MRAKLSGDSYGDIEKLVFQDVTSNWPWSDMNIQPRTWQSKALPLATEAIRRQRAVIIQAIMGAGKSTLIAAVLFSQLEKMRTIVVTVPRTQLLRELYETITAYVPESVCGVFYGAKKEPGKQLIVACEASLNNLSLCLEEQGREVDLWVADECHGSEAP